jgi:DNA repair exonuclease SbcCD nuclease subunit
MSKYLLVGDPHATVEDLDDCKELAAQVWGRAKANDATVVYLGDLYHTHAIIHAEVQYFWYQHLQDMKDDGVPVIILKGNHDAPGTSRSLATALIAHHGQAELVLHEPMEKDGILFCPYVDDGTLLTSWSNAYYNCKTLICHQTFDGSRYENGFFAGDGVDPDAIIQEKVISGHIHAPQEFGKIWYPGAPRWRTLSDANTDRALWLVEFNPSGRLVSKEAFDTGKVCRQIFHFVDTPDAPITVQPVAKAEYRIDIQGPQSWIDERKPQFETWARVRTLRTDVRAARVKESDGIGPAFSKWLQAFAPRHGTDKETLNEMVKGRLNGF